MAPCTYYLPALASAMALLMALLEMALFLLFASDASSSEGCLLEPMALSAAAWFLKRAAACANNSACKGSTRRGGVRECKMGGERKEIWECERGEG